MINLAFSLKEHDDLSSPFTQATFQARGIDIGEQIDLSLVLHASAIVDGLRFE